MGTRYLQESLNKQLSKHIQDKLPSIRKSLHEKEIELEQTMKVLGISEEAKDTDQTRTLMR